MHDMLNSLIGGAGGEAGGSAGGGDMLSGLLGMLGGGGGQGGGLEDILGAFMGGGGMDQGAGSGVSGISQQTGIPPEILMAGLSFLLGKLGGGAQQGSVPGGSGGGLDLNGLLQGMQPGGAPEISGGGLNLAELMQNVQGDQGRQYLESTGMHEELAQQTGLEPAQASQALQGILGALRGQSGGGSDG
jgi:hypothetical protein